MTSTAISAMPIPTTTKRSRNKTKKLKKMETMKTTMMSMNLVINKNKMSMEIIWKTMNNSSTMMNMRMKMIKKMAVITEMKMTMKRRKWKSTKRITMTTKRILRVA